MFSVTCYLLPVFFLFGCGFEPLYAKKPESQSELMAGVKIERISGRAGQQFITSLEDHLNPPGGVSRPAYRLKATLVTAESAIGVSRDNTVSRYNLYFNSDYTLYRISDDKAITSGSLNYVTSYNNLTNAYFSTYTSENDALKRGITELAELYRQRLSAYLDAGAPQHAIPVRDPKEKPLIGPFSVSPDPEKNRIGKGPLQ